MESKISFEIPTITAYTRNDFRNWLKKNHAKERRVAVILHKRHTGKTAPTHRELLEEAICFGWIDTTIKRLDEDTFQRTFAKRSATSRWSDNTLGYAKDLIKRKLMTPVGLEYYKHGLSRPTHDFGIPKNPDMPEELKAALAKNKKAQANFETFSPSTKRTYYRWILRGKLPETRKKRIKQIVASAVARNKNLLNPTQKENV